MVIAISRGYCWPCVLILLSYSKNYRVRKKDVASSERAEFMKSCKAGGSSGSTCRKIWRDMKKAKRQAKKGRKASYGMSMAESPRKAQGGMSLGKNVRSMIKGKPAK